MKYLIIKPKDWACTLEECEPGFFLSGEQLCFKSEYRRIIDGEDRGIEAFNSAGEAYHGGGKTDIVIPAEAIWLDL